MDDVTEGTAVPGNSAPAETVSAAASIRANLVELVDLCNNGLMSLNESDSVARQSLIDAKALAERAVKLSEKLAGQLRGRR